MRTTDDQLVSARRLDTVVACPCCHGERRTETERPSPGGEQPDTVVTECDACDGTGAMTADDAAKWGMRNADTADERCRAGAQWLRLFLIDNGADGVEALAGDWRSYGYDKAELTDTVAGCEWALKKLRQDRAEEIAAAGAPDRGPKTPFGQSLLDAERERLRATQEAIHGRVVTGDILDSEAIHGGKL